MSQGYPYGYGQQQPYGPPPPQPGMGAGTVLLIVGGVVVAAVLFVGGLFAFLHQSNHGPSPTTSAAPAGVPGGQVAKDICNKMTLAGVVKNCKEPEADHRTDGRTLPDVQVGFDVVGVPTGQGAVTYWLTDAAFQNDSSYPAGDGWVRCRPDPRVKPDDYPDQCVGSPKARIVVTWGATDAGEWGDCRVPSAGKENSVAVCAKKYPAEYARYHALYDAAKRVVVDSAPR